MKKVSALLGILILIVSFQNCSQKNLSKVDGDPTGISTQINSDATQTPAANMQKAVLWDSGHLQYLDLDLNTGKMIAYEEAGTVRGEKYCLTPSQILEAQSILTNSSICEPKIDYEAVKDRMCTMLYRYPYASLIDGSREYRLGEMTSGCDKPADLCGDKAQLFRNFVASVLTSLVICN